MKRISIIVLVSLIMMILMSGCSTKTSDNNGKIASADDESATYKTIGDIVDYGDSSFVYDEKTFVFVFTKDDVTYRATCDMPEDISKAMNDLDSVDEDFADKAKETAASLEISKLENLTESIPSQEELDKYIGKTGQDLLDEGWTIWSWDTDKMEFGMSFSPYNYNVVFDGKIEASEDLDAEKEIAPLKIKSVTYDGIGDAATIDSE